MASAAATIHEVTIIETLTTGLLGKAKQKEKLKACLDKATEQQKVLKLQVSSMIHFFSKLPLICSWPLKPVHGRAFCLVSLQSCKVRLALAHADKCASHLVEHANIH